MALVANPGRVLDKDELMKIVWPDTFVEEGALARNISALRKVLGDDAEGVQYIETIPKRGYRFVAPVQDISGSGQTHGDEQTNPRNGMRWAAGLVGVALLILAAGLTYSRLIRPPRTAPVNITSLAVLPLDNPSNDPAQEYFADGMTEELINSLAKIEALRVISRTSAMTYKGVKNKPLPRIARELNVDAIVEGSVLQSGNRVRITVENSAEHQYVPAMYIAAVYATLGEGDRSIRWIQKAYQERSDYMVYLKTEPSVDGFRSDPRFQHLLKLIAAEPTHRDGPLN